MCFQKSFAELEKNINKLLSIYQAKKLGKGIFNNETKKLRIFAFDNQKVMNNNIGYRFQVDNSNPVS